MGEQSTNQSEVPERWEQTDASRLTMSGYLPKNAGSHPVPTLPHEDASRRGEEVLQLVRFSGEELGRDNTIRILYIRAMGEQFASVDFLDRARETTKIVTEILEHGLDIDSQPEEVKAAIIEDINNLNALSERMWGRAEPERFSAMVARLRRKASAALADDSTPDHKRLAAQNLLLTLPEVDDALADTHDYTPSAELLETYEPRVRKKYASLLELTPEQGTLDRHELKSVFEAGIGRMADSWQLDNARNWKVEFAGQM